MESPERLDQVLRFYRLLDELAARTGGPHRLSKCTGRMSWPGRGVYFFFEDGERRSDSGAGPRVARVGTHALKAGSKSTLWNRLRQHRGSLRSGGGNHRGSIFRLLVGAAVIGRDDTFSPTWGVGSSATREVREPEASMERMVSSILGKMSVLVLPVEDDPGPASVRGLVERHSIALLSNAGRSVIDPPSERWLGHHCPRPLVRDSGLWNQNHVTETHDPAVLDVVQRMVRQLWESDS